MLHAFNQYFQYFLSLFNGPTPVESPDTYQKVTHASRKPAQEHVRCYNEPQNSEMGAIILGAEDFIIVNQ